jgi:hypothetical protein
MAQVTSGSITGQITDSKGQVLVGATVKALHVPTGTVYITTSTSKGDYTLPNLKIGGPYTLTINYVGHTQATFENLNVSLGTPVVLDGALDITGQTMSEAVVTGGRKGAIISSLRNGPSTTITGTQILEMPTINRSITDIARLTSQANPGYSSTGQNYGISFNGTSNKYNQFSIDGANSSDVFGLTASGTNGGQANSNPIPLEAIQEMQIVLAPYDITQGGFTGGGMNAVTRSGTNTFHGSAYGFGQNQSLIGKSVLNDTKYPTYKNYTYGASLGGAIIKNKLFFYANAEWKTITSPLAYDPTVAGSGSKFDPATLASLRQYVITTYGFDPGGYGNIAPQTKSNTFFGRIDWNISPKTKLTVRELYVNASSDAITRSTTSMTFSNSSYKFLSTSHSVVAELNSNISSSTSNVLRVTYTNVFDRRQTAPFPNVLIEENNLAYNIGSDYSSEVNSLKQHIWTVTDNFNLYKGDHTFTFGTNNEFYSTANAFLQDYDGSYTYGSYSTATGAGIAAFENNNAAPNSYYVSYTTPQAADAVATAKMKAGQFGVYAQDVYSIKRNFKLTYGVRLDVPDFFNHPPANTNFNSDPTFAAYHVSTSQMPKTRIVASPRVGFNWDVANDGKTQIRGGVGVFLGRSPFVWLSNQYSNTGVTNITYSPYPVPSNIRFNYDPKDQHLGAYLPTTAPAATATTINVVDRNFRLPRTLRTNLAVDRKLPWWGLIGTLEAIYTKTLYDINYKNLNLAPANGVVNLGPTTRPDYNLKRVTSAYTDVLELENTTQGYNYSFTAEVNKPRSHGWAGKVSYTYARSYTISDGTSSVALSNWRYAYSTNGLNNLDLTRSNFDMGSRVVGYISKQFKYAHDHLGTTIDLIYTGQSGLPFSYLYTKGVLGDDVTGGNNGVANTLVYLPKTAAEANFVDIKNSNGTVKTSAAQQWTDFTNFARANKYLNDHLGHDAIRNGDRTPWENHFDIRIAENIFAGVHRLDIMFDILNVGNLIDKNSGWNYYVTNQSLNLFTVTSNPGVANPTQQFDITKMNLIKGVYRPYVAADLPSRWRGQLGLRYSF